MEVKSHQTQCSFNTSGITQKEILSLENKINIYQSEVNLLRNEKIG